ncbi:MAG: htrA [Chlamydiales bacterium]|jgi:serine protease Do|nr:htrA [Chlamydiales bacterium]
MKYYSPFSLQALTLLAATFSPLYGVSQASPAVQEQVLPSFKEIAKKATPAVVLIRVQAKVNTRPGSPDSFDYQDPFDAFSDDFWRFFFGAPPKHHSQGPKKRSITGQGSGFIVSADGYILTNNHVVRDAESIQVVMNNGKEYEARMIGQDANTDLAVIKIEGQNYPYLPLGDSDALDVGDWVAAIGTPLNLQATVTAGIVSAKGRNNLRLAELEDFIQTDAAINQGNSGGPLLNMGGEVIGINTAIATNTGGYMGIGFAIPSNMANHVMDQLIQGGTVSRGYLGVSMQQIDAELAKSFGLLSTEGALVCDVVKGSPAEAAGIQRGDIILKLNGQQMPHIFALKNAIALLKPGSKVKLELIRANKPVQVTVEIGSQPNADHNLPALTLTLGFEVEAYTPELAQQLNYKEEKGVIIKNVLPGTPAYNAQLDRGTLILAVNHQKVDSVESFNQAVQKALQAGEKDQKGQQNILLLVRQGTNTRFVSLKVQP